MPSRGHRDNIYDQGSLGAGLAADRNTEFRTVCVTDFSLGDSPKGAADNRCYMHTVVVKMSFHFAAMARPNRPQEMRNRVGFS
jgi:hypothetical protein